MGTSNLLAVVWKNEPGEHMAVVFTGSGDVLVRKGELNVYLRSAAGSECEDVASYVTERLPLFRSLSGAGRIIHGVWDGSKFHIYAVCDESETLVHPDMWIGTASLMRLDMAREIHRVSTDTGHHSLRLAIRNALSSGATPHGVIVTDFASNSVYTEDDKSYRDAIDDRGIPDAVVEGWIGNSSVIAHIRRLRAAGEQINVSKMARDIADEAIANNIAAAATQYGLINVDRARSLLIGKAMGIILQNLG